MALTARVQDVSRRIDRMRDETEERQAAIRRVLGDPELTPAARRARAEPLQESLSAYVDAETSAIHEILSNVSSQADRHFKNESARDEMQPRLARAATRVAPLLAAGKAPGEIAEHLAQAGDLDAILALREAVPAWSISVAESARERDVITRETLLAVDHHLSTVATGDTADALQAMDRLDGQRARLDATVLMATSPNASSMIAVGLADAMASA